MAKYKHIQNRRQRRAERFATFGLQQSPQSPAVAPQNMPVHEGQYSSFEALTEAIVEANVPPGWEHDPWIQQRVQALIDHAYQGWMAGHEAGRMDETAIVAAQQQGYQRGVQEAERNAAEAYQRGYKQAVRALDGAKTEAFQEGYQAGFKAAQAEAKISEADRRQIRNDTLDEVLEQGRVIEESNPNMADGVKAMARMVRKLRKGKK